MRVASLVLSFATVVVAACSGGNSAPAVPVDDRPAVKLLRRIDAPVPDGPSTISVDGVVVVQLPSATKAVGSSYHVAPGTHSLDETGSGAPMHFTFQAEAGKSYVQRYGFTAMGPIISGDIWLAPETDPGSPPPGKARVKLIVENICRDNLVQIDGAAFAYPDQKFDNPGTVFDHDPRTLQVEILKLDGSASEGSQAISLAAGHYYVVKAYDFFFIEFGPAPGCINDATIPRKFELSTDAPP